MQENPWYRSQRAGLLYGLRHQFPVTPSCSSLDFGDGNCSPRAMASHTDKRTPTGHTRQKFNKLICFPGPKPPFFFLRPSLGKTVPQMALFPLLCSLLRQGRTARPLAYGNCKARILIKGLESVIHPCGPHFHTCTAGYTRIGWVQFCCLSIGASGPEIPEFTPPRYSCPSVGHGPPAGSASRLSTL